MYSIKNFIALIALVSFLELNSEDFDNYEKRTEVKDFIEKMHKKHKFDKEWLEEIFSDAKYQEKVVRIMNRQPEGVMTWSDYKGIMISQDRISSGSRFIQRYKQDLLRAEEIYGVPASIIAAIIGINKAIIVQNKQAPASIVLTTGLAIPQVVAVDNALVATVPSCIVPAVPPPATIARIHCKVGSIPSRLEDVTMMPAIIAEGVVIVSNKLSSQGM